VALDQSDLEEVVGTICGDDTIFIACRTPTASKALSRTLANPSAGELQ
jgi:arginine repressor